MAGTKPDSNVYRDGNRAEPIDLASAGQFVAPSEHFSAVAAVSVLELVAVTQATRWPRRPRWRRQLFHAHLHGQDGMEADYRRG
ncbi:hypothetical protein GCM10009619_18350 [Williamsia maris]